jgi:LysR family transcriptional regulator, mexEF-oprN operon transcriptional activator
MKTINAVNLRKVDLNLLVVFHTLMQERHVTRAAAKLHLTQGAVSAALGRLRSLFGDELFERSREGMTPTPKALAMATKIGQALAAIDSLVSESEEFDPVTASRTFHLAMSDDLEAVLLPAILQEVEDNGWSVRFSFHQTNTSRWQQALDDPKTDLVLCASPPHVPAAYRQSVLFASSYSCLYDGSRPAFSTPLTLNEYVGSSHLRVSYNAQRGFVDELLESQGYTRKASASISHFAGAINALRAAEIIATVPSYTAYAYACSAGLTACEPPIPVPRFTISLLWRVQREADPEHAWLRGLIEKSTGSYGTLQTRSRREDDTEPRQG